MHFLEPLLLLGCENLAQLSVQLFLQLSQQCLLLFRRPQHSLQEQRHDLARLWRPPEATGASSGRRETETSQPRSAFGRADVLPDHLLPRSHFKQRTALAGADQRISVGKSLGPRDVRGEEVGLLRRGIAPHRPLRPVSFARFEGVPPLLVDREHNLIHGGVVAVRPTAAVVEDQEVPRARQAGRDPMGVVLGKKPLVRACAGPIRPWITPPIEKIAPLAAAPAAVARGFSRRRAVIDDPDFVERVHGQHDLVEFSIVGDRIRVSPIGAAGPLPLCGRGAQVP